MIIVELKPELLERRIFLIIRLDDGDSLIKEDSAFRTSGAEPIRVKNEVSAYFVIVVETIIVKVNL